jgi:hypothetical protein
MTAGVSSVERDPMLDLFMRSAMPITVPNPGLPS